MPKNKKEKGAIEAYLTKIAKEATPVTHCCECTPGQFFQRHVVHIQYLDCDCDPKKYVLKKNEGDP